jgi:hypothetical protein
MQGTDGGKMADASKRVLQIYVSLSGVSSAANMVVSA